MPTQARDTRDALAHYGYAAAYVVAHSGDASIARQFAHDNPHMVRKLVPPSPVVLGSRSGWPLDRIIVPTETSVLQWQANAGTRGRSDPAGVDCEGAVEKLNARLLEVKDAGHYLTIENTEGTI